MAEYKEAKDDISGSGAMQLRRHPSHCLDEGHKSPKDWIFEPHKYACPADYFCGCSAHGGLYAVVVGIAADEVWLHERISRTKFAKGGDKVAS